MKLAWICYDHFEDTDASWNPVILFIEPDKHRYRLVIPIVYAEIEQ
jgi:hypothetical protein